MPKDHDRLEDHDQQRQTHGELRKQVTVCDRKGEMQAMEQ